MLRGRDKEIERGRERCVRISLSKYRVKYSTRQIPRRLELS